MSREPFTPDQVEAIRQNKYVLSATDKSIRYTIEFKEHFAKETEKGKTPTEIFAEAGFDVDVIGDIRISSFFYRNRNDLERPEGFSDLRRGNSGRPKKRELTKEEKKAIEKYKAELRHQQIHMLKKTTPANLKAVQLTPKRKRKKT